MHPTLLHIGSFELASYGLMTALGYALAAWYLYKRLHSIKLDAETFWNILFIAFVSALIGAKLLYIFVSWPQLAGTFTDKIAAIIKDFRYGFVFFGGAVLTIAVLISYFRYKKLPVLKTSDFLIVALPLGHAVGRIGCFLAGCCHGRPTQMPWGVVFTDPHSLVAREYLGVHLHPTQLYEAAANVMLFFLLHTLYKRPHKDGAVLAAYVLGYSLLRFSIEFFRGDFRGGFLLGLSPSQAISLTAAAAACVLLYFMRENKHG